MVRTPYCCVWISMPATASARAGHKPSSSGPTNIPSSAGAWVSALLHELETIAERIIDEDALIACHGRVVDDVESLVAAARDDALQVGHKQTGMRLGGGVERLVDAKMDLHLIAFEPATAALRQRRRFGRFRQAQQLAIECARAIFAARGHGELDVIDSDYGHTCSKCAILTRRGAAGHTLRMAINAASAFRGPARCWWRHSPDGVGAGRCCTL